MTQEQIAESVGKSRASVANAIRLLDLHNDIQVMVARGHLTVGHAKAILAIKDDKEQLLAADHIIKKKLTVRAAEKFTQDHNRKKSSPSPAVSTTKPEEAAIIGKIQNQLEKELSTRVHIHHGSQKGRIEIEYFGNVDFNRIIELLGISLKDL